MRLHQIERLLAADRIRKAKRETVCRFCGEVFKKPAGRLNHEARKHRDEMLSMIVNMKDIRGSR